MGKIKVLELDIVNKIAAGEVIERPASIVKELIENSIDAGATSIVIEVKEGGISFIKVSDNGSGMDEEDLFLSYKPHATSKIVTADDLFNVTTLGFRGEALSSIAAVSRLEVSTRLHDSPTGQTIIVEGGSMLESKDAGMPAGTTVIVRDLFFNTPARRKHLKSPQTESSHITDIVTRYSLSKGGISFRLIEDGKEVLNVPKTDDIMNKIVAIYGKETARHMVPIEHSDELATVSGLIGKPYLARKTRSNQTLFVNGRYVRNQTVSNAVSDAYHTLLFLDRHPAYVLFVEIDFEKTDVNVHPQKETIRIEDEEQLYKTIFEAMQKSLTGNMVPEVSIDPVPTQRKPSKQYTLVEGRQETLSDGTNLQKDINKPVESRMIGPVRIIGQVSRLYIIAENASGILIIDQHAAQERVYYERYMEQFRKQEISRQRFLKPIMVELSPAEYQVIVSSLDVLSQMGFSIEEYGANSFRISSMPQAFGSFSKDLLSQIASELKVTGDVEERIAKKACRKAIKAGDLLTDPQMEALIRDLDTCEKPFACPHGRPTMISLPLAELEGKFKRVG